MVGELCFDAGAFVGKRQWLTPFRVDVEQTFAVFARLFFDAGQSEAFGFRFDRADGFAVDKKKIIDFIAIFQKSFANRDPAPAERLIVLRF